MTIEIKPCIISQNYQLIEDMMQQLQASEQSMHNKSAAWQSIKTAYMCHLIEMQEEEEGTCLLAYADSAVAGFMMAYTEEEDESRIEIEAGKLLYISDGFVYPEFRRFGIYKQLNSAMEQHYITRGARRILRYTLFTNQRMQQFLTQQGYQPVRVLYEKWLSPDGKNIEPVILKEPEN